MSSVISQTHVRTALEGIKKGLPGQEYTSTNLLSVSFDHYNGQESEINTVSVDVVADDTDYELVVLEETLSVNSGTGATAASIAGLLKDAYDENVVLIGVGSCEVVGNDLVITAGYPGVELDVDDKDPNLSNVIAPQGSVGERIPFGVALFFKDDKQIAVSVDGSGKVASDFAGISRRTYDAQPTVINDGNSVGYEPGQQVVSIRRGAVYVCNMSGTADSSNEVWVDVATGMFYTADPGGGLRLDADLPISWKSDNVLKLDITEGL